MTHDAMETQRRMAAWQCECGEERTVLEYPHGTVCAGCGTPVRLPPASVSPAARAETPLFDYPAAARSLHLWLREFCDETLPYPEMIAEAGRRAMREIEALRAAASPGAETPDGSGMKALEEYLAHVRRLEVENKQLWEVVRQKERDDYAASNSLDVAELDATCANLYRELASLQARAVRGERERDEARELIRPVRLRLTGSTAKTESQGGESDALS